MSNIRDVAKLADVSIASVSRILNADPSYKTTEETKKRVFDSAYQLGYSLNQNNKKKPTRSMISNIGCITNLTADRYVDSYFKTIMDGVKKHLIRNDIGIDFMHSQFDIPCDDIGELFKSSTKGVLLLSLPSSPDFMQTLKNYTKNIVGVDTVCNDIDNVRYNRFEAGCKAMQYLIDNGHSKIAFVGSNIPKDYTTYFGRYDAYHMMQSRYSLPSNPMWVIDCKWQKNVCFSKTQEMMLLSDKPTAIFVASDHMAIAAISALSQIGYNVPNDISIISISDIEEAKYFNPPLTTIAVPQEEIGETAASLLLSRINGDLSLVKQVYVPTTLVERNSVKNIKK